MVWILCARLWAALSYSLSDCMVNAVPVRTLARLCQDAVSMTVACSVLYAVDCVICVSMLNQISVFCGTQSHVSRGCVVHVFPIGVVEVLRLEENVRL